MNTFILKTAAAQGWLNEEQLHTASDVMLKDKSISILDYMSKQGWLGQEHVDWLKHMAETQKPAAGGHAPATTTGHAAVLMPTDINFEVKLGPDQALSHLNDYLKIGQFYGASDVHLGVAAPPIMRRYGSLQPMWPHAPLLTAEQTERLMMGFITEEQKAQFKERGDLDFCYSPSHMGRFRTSVVRQRIGIDGVFRIINSKVKTMDELKLPQQLKALTKFHNGLVLVTGAVGSGKSTTLASFIEEVNCSRRDHIITLEDPIEYIFKPKGCQITQREVHTHTESFANALRASLREDPDVIMVGEMRDLETIQLAITASETGHLVFATLHTSSAARTLDRLLDAFPTEQQAQIRTMVAGSLRGIVSQQLLPRSDGTGRVMAMEVLITTPAAAKLIREGKTFMLPGVMQTGKKLGCKLMDDALMDLLNEDLITPQEAYDRAEVKTPFKEFLTD